MNKLKLIITCVLILLGACAPKVRGPNELLVGVIAGPEAALVEAAKDLAAQKGLHVRIIEFEDYAMPNRALAEGDIDLNIFQHQPYLDQVIKKQNYAFSAIAKTFIYPMGIYSLKHTTIKELPEGAMIGLPNDPSNQARALLLLAKEGLIGLEPVAEPMISNILSHNKNFKFVELDAALLARSLQDLDLAVINTNYALVSGLNPSKALGIEAKDSPYANLIVARTAEKDLAKYQIFVTAMHDPKITALARKLFKGYAIAAW